MRNKKRTSLKLGVSIGSVPFLRLRLGVWYGYCIAGRQCSTHLSFLISRQHLMSQPPTHNSPAVLSIQDFSPVRVIGPSRPGWSLLFAISGLEPPPYARLNRDIPGQDLCAFESFVASLIASLTSFPMLSSFEMMVWFGGIASPFCGAFVASIVFPCCSTNSPCRSASSFCNSGANVV